MQTIPDCLADRVIYLSSVTEGTAGACNRRTFYSKCTSYLCMECVFKTSGQLTYMDKIRSRLLLRLNKEFESNALVCSKGEYKMRGYAVGLLVDTRLNDVLLNNNQNFRIQPTVTFPIGGHVNVLHNYKKT